MRNDGGSGWVVCGQTGVYVDEMRRCSAQRGVGAGGRGTAKEIKSLRCACLNRYLYLVNLTLAEQTIDQGKDPDSP